MTNHLSKNTINRFAKDRIDRLPGRRKHSFHYYLTTMEKINPNFIKWAGNQTRFYQPVMPEPPLNVYCLAHNLIFGVVARQIRIWRVFPNQKTPCGKPRRELVLTWANWETTYPK